MGVAAFRPERRDGAWVAQPLWTTKDVSLYLSNAVVVGDTLFGLSQRPACTRLEPLKRYTVADSPTWAQPVLAGNRMLIRDATAVAVWTVD